MPDVSLPSGEWAISTGSLVLVTGANSFHDLHIVDQLLLSGYRVWWQVRSAEKAMWTSEYLSDRYGSDKYTTAIVPDMLPQGASDLAAFHCSGYVHVAAIMTFSSNPQEVFPLTARSMT
ncbi:hypothetical protein B0A50_08021 [Salinomyces thailandicus]|uniref:Uncharacterized protein n=1 Tax=Salinomyces thailandicus TaxID=706561 RepID=A0A4U0TKQ7_9PEZI|nr:hypothetical protein B0A50_08021 [Salinomyces thailandica]